MLFYFCSLVFIVSNGILYEIFYEDKVFKAFIKYELLLYLFLFSAIRFGIGIDYNNYRGIYEGINSGGVVYKYTEPLFYMFIKFCNFLRLDYKIFVLICSFFTIYFFGKSIKYIDDKYLFVYFLTYYCFCYISSYTLIRQLLSVSITIYAWCYKDIKKRKTIILLIIACLIHKTFWIFFILFLFSTRVKISRKLFFFGVFIGLIILEYTSIFDSLLNYVLASMHLVGARDYKLTRHFGLVALLRCMYVIIYFLLLYKTNLRNSYPSLFLFTIIMFELLGTRLPIFATRMPITFYSIYFVIYNRSVGICKLKQYSIDRLLYLTSILIMIMIFSASIIRNDNEIIPYTTIFNNKY